MIPHLLSYAFGLHRGPGDLPEIYISPYYPDAHYSYFFNSSQTCAGFETMYQVFCVWGGC